MVTETSSKDETLKTDANLTEIADLKRKIEFILGATCTGLDIRNAQKY